ncbi:DUF4394 domain-containing protein, partial [Brevifollis gellanilyticus]|uniref:DUF4394 domain-containing protein n=1 Tax=Brevifollis gellanilyticus TaxID=748831 RepID=UPI0011BDD4B5
MKKVPHNSVEALEPRLAPAGVIALTTNDTLISFDSATPASTSTTVITGILATENVVGIDFRPATGELYALVINEVAGANNDEGRIYKIIPSTGAATRVDNTPFFSAFTGAEEFAFDFNPAADRIRITTDLDQNFRVNPNNGALAGTDTTLSPGSSAIVGVAYTNNVEGATATTLYGIDSVTDSLILIGSVNGTPNSPNGGLVTNVGALGFDVSSSKVGFDISARAGAFAVFESGGISSLYSINLTTGAATLVGAVGDGTRAIQGISVAPPNDLTIVNATTATYTDLDGDKVTIQITGAAAGASLGVDDFSFLIGANGSQLRLLNLGDDGQEWARANITITAVPVAGKGDSFANIGHINASGVDLGKVSINGDLGRIDAGQMGNAIPGLASLTVQSMGAFSGTQLPNASSTVSNILGKLGGLTVKSDFMNSQISVLGADGSITSILIGGNLDARTATGAAGIASSQAMGSVTINGSIYGGSVLAAGGIYSATTMGNVTVGGSLYGGTFDETGYIASAGIMGNVLVKGSIVGGTQYDTGYIAGYAGMGNVTLKGSLLGGAVVHGPTDDFSGCLYTDGKMGALVIGGNMIGSNGDSSGSVYAAGGIKSVLVSGSIKAGSGPFSGAYSGSIVVRAGGMGNVTIGGDLTGGFGSYSGSLVSLADGSIANVTIGGSVTGQGNLPTGIISDNQIGAIKITGEVSGARISAEGGAGSPAALLAIKSLSVGQDVNNSRILAGHDTTLGPVATNPAATLGQVTVGGDWILSTMKAGAMGTISIKGNLDGRGTIFSNGIFSLGTMGNLSIGGNLYGGTNAETGKVDADGAMGTITIGGSIYGGGGTNAGAIEAGGIMGNVLVKGSVYGGTDSRTGHITSLGHMGSVTIKGSIIGGTVVDPGTDFGSGQIRSAANMGAAVIGGSLIGGNGESSGAVSASGILKSVVVNGDVKGTASAYSGSIQGDKGIGSVSILGDLVAGAGLRSGSILTTDATGSIGNVTIGGSLTGGHALTGIMSQNQLGAVKIIGGMVGGRISAQGGLDAATSVLAGGIKSISIGGTMQNAQILSGYAVNGAPSNPDASIGAVTVGGNFIASSIVAGSITNVDGQFGSADDVKIFEAAADTVFSSIASVTIKGYASGTAAASDHYGIVAEKIGTVKVGAASFVLAAGTDTAGHLIGTSNDLRVRE